MDFELAEEMLLVQRTAREFADKELAPVAAKLDAGCIFPRENMKKLAQLGFCGILVPEEYGGAALGNLALAIVCEEINRVCASTGVTLSVHNSLASSPIIRHGTEEQKKKYLPKMASGEWLGAYGLTEPNAGSDAASIETTARKDGGSYVLNGSKIFITTGSEADLIIVFARTNPDKSLRAKGLTAFILEKTYPGFKTGPPEHKLGLRASNTTALFFEDCCVPAENVLGGEGNGFKVAMDTLDGGRIGIASQALGILRACLDASVKYAKDRVQFGKPLAEFQAIQWKIADMATALDAARLLTYRAAQLRDQKKPHTQQAAIAKLFASEAANKAASETVQIYGGVGYTREFPVERFFRDVRITQIYEGTSEVQRLVIARNVLGK